ncbi:hypothetical protein EP7_003234 [Isosphaeraceae bacterium EP7]
MSQGRSTQVHALRWALALAIVGPTAGGCRMAQRRHDRPAGARPESRVPALPMISAEAPRSDSETRTTGYEVVAEPGEEKSPPEFAPAPTPMLDRAIVRSKAIQDGVVAGMTQPAPAVAPASTPDLPLIPVSTAAAAPAELAAEGDALPTMPVPEPTPPAPAVVVAANPAPAPAPKPEAKPEPTAEEAWDEALARLRALAKNGQGSGDAPGALAWTLPVIDWLARPAGDEGAGADPIRPVIVALIREAEPVPGRESARIREAVGALEAASPLEMTDLRWCRNVYGFGEFEPIDEPAFHPGQAAILYCELAGVHSVEADGQFRSKLQAQLAIVPDGGGAPVWTQSFDPAEDRCRRRRRDFFVNYSFSIPESLAPGLYRLRLTQTDQVAGRGTTREIAFSIEPKVKAEPAPAAASAAR